MEKSAHGVLFSSGEVPVPILSVISSGTRQPFRNRLSKLNHAIISTILREIVSPYWSRSSRKVSSRRVPLGKFVGRLADENVFGLDADHRTVACRCVYLFGRQTDVLSHLSVGFAFVWRGPHTG